MAYLINGDDSLLGKSLIVRLTRLSFLNSRKLALLVVGILFLLAGIVFALQGANVITGSSLMSGNSTYIYVGAVVAIIGLALIAWSTMVGSAKSKAAQSQAPQPM